jgi:hypothetical protein
MLVQVAARISAETIIFFITSVSVSTERLRAAGKGPIFPDNAHALLNAP